jgi:hypothetical protein
MDIIIGINDINCDVGHDGNYFFLPLITTRMAITSKLKTISDIKKLESNHCRGI